MLTLSRRTVILFLTLFSVSLVLYTLGVLRVKSVLWGDTRYYYSYTRSLVFDRDINFENEAYLPEVGFPNPPQVSPKTQLVTNKFSPGSPILWIPGFLVGQTVTQLLHFIGVPVRLDGFSLITQYLTAIWAMGFSLLGFVFIYDAIRRKFSTDTAWKSIAFLYLASQMFYYTAADPLNSHSASFVLSAILLWGTYRYLTERGSYQWITLLGLLGGLLSLVRNQDTVVLVPIGLLLLFQPGKLIQRLFRLIVFGASWFSIVSIQLLMTFYLYGQFSSPYLIQGEKIYWLQPDFFRVLFTQQNGLFFFAPGLILCLVGLYWGSKHRDILSHMGLIVFGLGLYGVAAWAPEIIGGPYGTRMFISTLPWLMVGFGYLINHDRVKRISSWQLLLILGILTANNILQTIYMLATS